MSFFLHYQRKSNRKYLIICRLSDKLLSLRKITLDMPATYYKENIKTYSRELLSIGKRIYLIGSIRLAVVISAIILSWLFRNEGTIIIITLIATHLAVFLGLLKYVNKLSFKKEYLHHLLKVNEDEISGLEFDHSVFDGYPERINPRHPFTFDLDIFGDRSVFQSINRTKTAGGKEVLADLFENPSTNKEEILIRRSACKELSELSDLRQNFSATAMLHPGSISDLENLKKFTEQADLIPAVKIWKTISVLLPLLWLAALILAGTGIIGYSVLIILFFASLGISYSLSKKTGRLLRSVGNKVKVLSTYSSLLKIMEEQLFSSDLLRQEQRKLICGSAKASVEIKKLSDHLNALELGKTFPGGLVMNIVFLWEIAYAIKIESWKKKHKNDLENWFEALAAFDALCSLGSFAFNRPDFIYPEISDQYFDFEAKNMGHLLLKDNICVKNDITISHSPYFLIVTGANMAGKSTYLRTVGLNYLLGCIGIPVYAEKMRFFPTHMISSLRTADSLVNSESYFFAELKRLSEIIDKLKKGEKLFIILDEILKGTNSADKQKGSFSLIKQFLSLDSCGIIATHDLALGKLEELYPNKIHNICFEADIRNDELYFSYKLRQGIAQNMNACFLMNKMGISIEK